MGVRRSIPFALAVAVLASACGEQGQDRESMTGPEFKPAPPAGACDFNGLSGLIRDYFPGPRQNTIVSIKDNMATAGQFTSGARTHGFVIMDSVGSLSRNTSVTTDPEAGAKLTVGLINCMFSNASDFTYPDEPIADFTKALTNVNGGAYYVRGGGTTGVDVPGRSAAVLGTDDTDQNDPIPTNLSGLRPPLKAPSTTVHYAWNEVLSHEALIYGYRVPGAQLEYEWSAIPSATEFSPGVVVTVCDDTDESTTAMVLESGVGVLAYVADNVCGLTQSMTMIESGWGPRALASRLARVVADAMTPAPLQAAMIVKATSGSGGTATTFKSKFKTESVEEVKLSFTTRPPSNNLKKDQFIYDFVVQATAPVDNSIEGVNGTCIYLTGSNNNGVGTDLLGDDDPDGCAPPANGGLVSKTKSELVGGELTAGFATFENVGVTKTGGLVLTASSTNGLTTGVFDRTGQTFTPATIKLNVKP